MNSTNQKLNTRSSIESEIIGVHDCMPAVCWTRCFMDAQGYQVMVNIFCQKKKSKILPEKNGNSSSSKRTKYISIRCFFITDCISKKELNVECCPTSEMIGDFMTKPTQVSLFKNFIDLIMGVIPIKKDV